MKLEGSLDTFSLPDILQLLAFTKKTGALRLTANSAGTTGVVHVCDGVVSAAVSDMSRQSLARRVVGAALVGDEALAAAVDRARREGVGVVRALLDSGALTEESILPVARQQVIDAVCDLLRWPEGEFAFFVDQLDPDDLSVAVSVEDLVAEGQRRLAAWPALTALIPSPATTLSLSVAPSSDPTCSREEWALLALVDGRRTVSAIVSLLGAGEYAVVRALAALVERGLLVTSDGGAAGTGGLADLERRQNLLAGLEGAGASLPAPRSAVRDTAPAGSDDELSAAVAALATEAPSDAESALPTADTDSVAEVAETTAQASQTPVAVAEPLDQPGSQPDSQPVEEPVQVAAPAQTRVETTATVAAETATVAAEAASTAPVSAGSDTSVPVTMGSAALDPAAVPAQSPAPTPGGEDDPAVTRSVLLRLIAGVQGL